MYRLWIVGLVLAGVGGLCGCEPFEPAQVNLPVVVDASGLEATVTDLGYEVEVDEARMVFEDLLFTVRGEEHRATLRSSRLLASRFRAWLIPNAWAHPGHSASGEVTGELRGRFVVDWGAGQGHVLGTATLLEGRYESANLTFTLATSADGLEADDALKGHTAYLRGIAHRDGVEVAFEARIASPPRRELIGIPFAYEVTATSTAPLGLQLLPTDPFELDSLFDGIDFFALADDDGLVTLGADGEDAAHEQAYHRLRRTFQTHDHFLIQPMTGHNQDEPGG